MRRLLDRRIGQSHRIRVLEIRDAEQLILFRDAHQPVPPEHAIRHVLLEALFAEGDVGFDEVGVDVVAVNGAVLDDAD